jgi:hypothetical protein
MDTFFSDPKGLRLAIQGEMKREQEEGELTEEELSRMVEAAQPPLPVGHPSNPVPSRPLRGEGGSGEKSKATPAPYNLRSKVTVGPIPWTGAPPLQPPPPLPEVKEGPETPADEEKTPRLPQPARFVPGPGAFPSGGEGSGSEEEEEREEDHGDNLHGGDYDAEEADVSIPAGSSYSKSGDQEEPSLGELKAYCEDQFAYLSSIIQALNSRIQILEHRTSTSVPLAMTFAHGSRADPSSPPRHARTRSGMGVPKQHQERPAPTQEGVQAFLKLNSTYPSLKAVRAAKLRTLQAQMGLPPTLLDAKVSEWSVDGLYTLLCTHHEA